VLGTIEEETVLMLTMKPSFKGKRIGQTVLGDSLLRSVIERWETNKCQYKTVKTC